MDWSAVKQGLLRADEILHLVSEVLLKVEDGSPDEPNAAYVAGYTCAVMTALKDVVEFVDTQLQGEEFNEFEEFSGPSTD